MPELTGAQIADLSAHLPFPRIILIPEFEGLPSTWVTARDVGGLLTLEVKKNLLLRHNRLIKRVLDYLIAIPLFLFSLPLMAILCLVVMAVSRGSPFYFQIREGQGGEPFAMLKLRTMYTDAEARLEDHLAQNPNARREWNRYFKLRNDPRILRGIGNFLRQSSLDELPQLLNVLRGNMSLVGPRPFPIYHVQAFDEDFRKLRSSVPPGLTGLWQVKARSEADIDEQKALDTYYIRNWSPLLDVYLLFKTITVVISGKGAR